MEYHELDGSIQRMLWFHEEICHKHGDWTNVEVLFDGTTINQNCDGRWNQRIWAVDGWYYRYSIGKLWLHIKLGWCLPRVPEQLHRTRQGEKTKDGPMRPPWSSNRSEKASCGAGGRTALRQKKSWDVVFLGGWMTVTIQIRIFLVPRSLTAGCFPQWMLRTQRSWGFL